MGATFDLSCLDCCDVGTSYPCYCSADSYSVIIGGVVERDPEQCGDAFGTEVGEAGDCSDWNRTHVLEPDANCVYQVCNHLCSNPGQQNSIQLIFTPRLAYGTDNDVRAIISIAQATNFDSLNPDACEHGDGTEAVRFEKDFDSCNDAEGVIPRVFSFLSSHCDFTAATAELIRN